MKETCKPKKIASCNASAGPKRSLKRTFELRNINRAKTDPLIAYHCIWAIHSFAAFCNQIGEILCAQLTSEATAAETKPHAPLNDRKGASLNPADWANDDEEEQTA